MSVAAQHLTAGRVCPDALITGLALGLRTRWGVLRHRWRWVTAKLLLIVSVVLVGALVIGPAGTAMRDGTGGAETELILAGAYDVLALALATGLSVYKPGTRRPRARAARHSSRRSPS